MSEKVLLVAVEMKNEEGWIISDVIEEMKELVVACQGQVLESVICRLQKPAASTLIGEGKVQEIAGLCAALSVDTVIFSQDLKGSQQRNLEETFKVKTIDRTQLILDIFARRAKSMEGKMQVELAQLQYLLPRLVGKGVEMSRLGGGIGTMGPGETKLEVDRRRIAARITRLKKDLQSIVADRQLKRKKRREHHIPAVSLVGYTNAGKSTLLNALTGAGQTTQDGLFTTLDSLSRQLVLPNQQKIIVSDTVGFMHDLPHHLIESFKATLEEVQEADLLLHVVDVSHPNFRNFYEAVLDVLKELDVLDKPIVTVFNKIDKLKDPIWLNEFLKGFEKSISISALKGENVPQLINLIGGMLSGGYVNIDVQLPLNRMDLVNLAHTQGQVHSVKYSAQKVRLKATLPAAIVAKFKTVS